MAALHSMIYRLCKLPFSINSFMNELQRVKEIAVINCYTLSTVESLIKKHEQKLKKEALSTFLSQKEKQKIKASKIRNHASDNQ